MIPQDYREAYDFMYYSILGSNWNTSIQHFQFHVNFEKALTEKEVNQFHVFSGNLGQTNNALNVQYNLTKDSLSGQADNIGPNQAITLYGRLRKNYFVGAKQPNTLPTWICSVLAAICALIVLYNELKRRKAHVTPVVSFYPPEDLDPAQVGYIIDESSDMVDLMALIPYWADAGYLTIEEKENDTILHKVKELEKVPLYQQMIWDGLFSGKEKRSMNKLTKRFAEKMEASKEALADVFTGKKALSQTSGSLALAVFAILLLSVSVLTNSKIRLLSGLIYAVLVLCFSFLAFAMNYVGGIKQTFQKSKMTIAIKVLSILVFLVLLIALVDEKNRMMGILPTAWLLFVAILVFASIFFIQRLHTPSEYWLSQAGPLLGFKEFIEKAELDQLEKLSQENPQYYYRVIPYAMVFGLSKTWAEKFTNIPLEPPTWYTPYSNQPYSAWMYYAMLDQGISMPVQDRIASYQEAQMKSATSSSSGSFGGFSGGGAGGGGGGSW